MTVRDRTIVSPLGLAAAALALTAAPAGLAQTPSAAQAETREETIVTARKREERLQDVPLTISVLTESTLRDAGVRSALDLAVIAPGLTYELTGGRTNAKPVIRGITVASTSSNQQKNSSYIDGVYINASVVPPPFIEVARVEVLKGPQATAFGRSTFAGAINYVTVEPGEEWKARAELLAASQGEYELSAIAGGPIALDGRLRGQIAAYGRTYDGNDDWVSTAGVKLGWEKTEYLAGTLMFEPTDAFSIKVRASREEADDGPTPVRYIDPSQRNGVFPVTLASARGTAPAGTRFNQFYPVGEISGSTRPYVRDFSQIPEPGARVERERLSAVLNWDVAGHTITLQAATNSENARLWQPDIVGRLCWVPGTAGRPSCALEVQGFEDTQYEARIASAGDGPFSYLLGYSYIDISNRSFFSQPLTGALFFSNSIFNQDVTNGSPFASASLRIGEKLTLGAEVRQSSDEVTSLNYTSCTFPATSAVFGSNCAIAGVAVANPFTGQPLRTPQTRSETFERTLYRGTIDYKFTDDWMAYGVVSRGNQPGGFNLGAIVPDNLRVVEEELLDNYELGLKGALFDGGLVFSAAVFHMDWSNQTFRRSVQILALPDGSSIVLQPGAPIPPGSNQLTSTYVVNQGSSTVEGVEAEAAARLGDLSLRGTVAYTKAELENFCSEFLFQLTLVESSPGSACRNVDGNLLEAQPEWTWSASADYRRPLGGGPWAWFARGDHAFTGRKFDSEMNLAFTPAANITNLRTGFENDFFRIELFGANITDDDTPVRLARLTDESLPTTAPGTTPAGAAVTVAGISRQSIAIAPRKERQVGVRIGIDF
jgi:iron complex outermembrane receptor protein